MTRYQPETAAPETLSGLQAKHVGIWAYCERCQHSASLDIEVLLKRLPGSLGVPDVGKRLKCSECGKVDVFARPDWRAW